VPSGNQFVPSHFAILFVELPLAITKDPPA
jgi:hypothetical protein